MIVTVVVLESEHRPYATTVIEGELTTEERREMAKEQEAFISGDDDDRISEYDGNTGKMPTVISFMICDTDGDDWEDWPGNI